MRTVRIMLLLVVAAAVSVVGLAAPARAGGWATTILDPLPDRVEAGRTYTVGFWVLQHGSHPFEGDLGAVGLRLVGPKQQAVTYPGVALGESAHFAAAILLPSDGSWRVVAIQGLFAEYEIGTLQVPGTLTANPVPPSMPWHEDSWGLIRPPIDDTGAAAAPAPNAAAPVANVAAPPAGTAAEATVGGSVGLLPLVGAAALALLAFASAAVLLVRRRASPG